MSFRYAQALAFVVLAACGARSATEPSPAVSAAEAPSRTDPAPPTYAVITGPWSHDLVGGAVTSPGGLAVDAGGVSMIVTSIDVEPVLLTRDLAEGAPWQRETLVSGRAIDGELVARTALLVRMGATLWTQDIVVVTDGRVEEIATGCEVALYGSHHLLSPDVLTYLCHDQRVVARRSAAGWTSIATLPPQLVDGTVGDDGTIYLLDMNLVAPTTFWVIHDDVVAESSSDVGTTGDVGFCGGRLYATFEQPSSRQAVLGTWRDEAWELEPLGADVAGAGVLALDEACHPFIAIGDVVYARGAHGWTGTSLGVPGAMIHDVAAHEDTVFATYLIVTDSAHAGFASAPLTSSR